MLHLVLHVMVPLLVAVVFYRSNWRRALLVMLATMLVDVDHLLAEPVYDPQRCSIGFHPLHQAVVFPLYLALCFLPRTRLVGLGLSIHMILDGVDCLTQ
ncbi:DUF6122 family protein [Litorivivens sp.]|uniref:DUF6122 family protein n=1 Tax=Litorivivens sp. TaxID=2020868 RepID=UPI0035699596